MLKNFYKKINFVLFLFSFCFRCSKIESQSYMKVSKRYEDPKFDGYESSPNETLRGILVGPKKSGKTTLFSKITSQNVKKLDKSKVHDQSSAYGNRFEITDIPGGFGVGQENEEYNSDHLFKIKLSTVAFNTIFIVIQFDRKFENILKDYQSASKYFKERDQFDKKAVVLLTKFDELSEKEIKEQDFFNKKIIEAFSSIGFQNQIIFCSGTESDPEDICDAMYQCLSTMKPSTMKLTESKYSKEKTISPIEKLIKSEQIEENYKYSIDTLDFQFKAHIEVLQNSTKYDYDKNQLCHYIVSHFRKKTEILEESFIEKNGKDMVEMDDYCSIEKLKTKSFKYLNLLQEKADSINNFSNKIVEIMNKMLRKCPKCHKIWSKLSIDGCDNTTCGNRGIGGKDVNPNKKSLFKPIYTKETQDKKDEFKIIYHIELEKNEEPSTTSKVSVQKEEISGGCGASFNWEKDAIVLTHEELSQFKEIMPKDYIENFLEKNIESIKKKLKKDYDKSKEQQKEKNLNSI